MKVEEWLYLPFVDESDYDSMTRIEINADFYSRIENRQEDPVIQSLLKMYWREANGN